MDPYTFCNSTKTVTTRQNDAWDADLIAMIKNFGKDKHFKEDMATHQFCEQFVHPVTGIYIKKANKVDKRTKGNHISNCIWFFLDWKQWPCRIFRHYGHKSKLNNLFALRYSNQYELDYIKRSPRLVRIAFHNFNSCAYYHLKHGQDIDFLKELSEDGLVLDGLPLDLDLVHQALKLPEESKFNFYPEKKKRQFTLAL